MVNFTLYIFSTTINNNCQEEEENKNEMKDKGFKEMGCLDLSVNFRQGVENGGERFGGGERPLSM